jgi:FHS family glucose/mannose:H+ symporter-like MFS transporter
MRSSRAIFFCACAGMLLFGITLITLGSVAPALREKFQLDAIASGTLFSILPIGILLGSLFFGPFSDRYGYKIILILSCILIFIGFEGIAYSTSTDVLKVCIFLFGLGGGAINGATNAVVADISETNKGANLSLLGVFFAIGALGMPSLLGLLEARYSFEAVVSAIGLLPVAVAILCAITKFPQPKQAKGMPFSSGFGLLKEGTLIAIGSCLFCVSSFEAIINNWTTTYLTEQLTIPGDRALFALSFYVVGMAVMRILLGSVFRATSVRIILLVSFLFLLAGCLTLKYTESYTGSVSGLVFIGIGLAAGFPVMLGFVGNLFASVSGTAFSIVLTIALVGNMLVNFIMGIVVSKAGIEHITSVAFVLLAAMLVLSIIIVRKIKLEHV